MYKYIIFFCFFIFSCEKNNSIITNETGHFGVMLCESSDLLPDQVSVLSFNRLNNTSLNSVSELIETIQPDIIGLQESYEMGLQIADRFNYCFYGNTETSTAILSRYPIEFLNHLQSKVFLTDSLYLNFFNIHLAAYPYQPYDIRDTLITTSSQAIYQAEQTRGLEVDDLISYINLNNNTSQMPILLVGDFNEPSHLDWISGSENAINFQIPGDFMQFVVDWPTSNKILDLYFIDAYREKFPNPIQNPGYTWTPNSNINEVHDRIDYIYYLPRYDYNGINDTSIPVQSNVLKINLDSIYVVGPDNMSDIIIDNYESDHRGVFAVFSLEI